MRAVTKILNVAVLLCLIQLVQAQVSIGLKTGLNYTNVSVAGVGDLVPDAKMIDGWNAGLVAEIPINSSFAFQPELSYTRKGFKVKEGFNFEVFNLPVPLGVEAHTRVSYVEVPLLGKYKFGAENVGGYLIAGPYVAYGTQAELQTIANFIIDINVYQTDIDLSNDTFHRMEAGAMGGLGFWAGNESGKFFADARFQHGLTDLFNDPIVDVQMKNKGISLNVGYLMSF